MSPPNASVDLEQLDAVCEGLTKLGSFDPLLVRGRLNQALEQHGYKLQERHGLVAQAQRYRVLFEAVQGVLAWVRTMRDRCEKIAGSGRVDAGHMEARAWAYELVEKQLTTVVEKALVGRIRDRAKESRTHRARQKAKGLCAHCASPVRKPGASRCETHWKKHKAVNDQWRKGKRGQAANT